jgi:DnaJ-class molecular chaperone
MSYNCPKCSGKGEIAAYRNVLGGLCFCCKGAGKVDKKPALPTILWSFFADGNCIVNKRAKTEADAMRKANAFFLKSPMSPEKITVRPA